MLDISLIFDKLEGFTARVFRNLHDVRTCRQARQIEVDTQGAASAQLCHLTHQFAVLVENGDHDRRIFGQSVAQRDAVGSRVRENAECDRVATLRQRRDATSAVACDDFMVGHHFGGGKHDVAAMSAVRGGCRGLFRRSRFMDNSPFLS